MQETQEIDTKQESPSPNGHDPTWQTFDNDQDFLTHILSRKPAGQLVEVPEWGVKILCRALSAESRFALQKKAYDEKTKLTDYRRVFHQIVIDGCCNPITSHPVFTEAHRDFLMREQDGGIIDRLAIAVLRASRILPNETEDIKKN